ALEEAVAAKLVVEVPGRLAAYRFAHALVRDTLYGRLSAARRTVLHRQVAAAIEVVHAGDLDDHFPALAHHFARAAVPAALTGKAVDYSARAARRASAQLAYDEAVAYFRQALDLLHVTDEDPDLSHRLRLLLDLGQAQRSAGDSGF